MLKVYGLLIILGLLAGVGYGAYFYYNDTQQRIATLRSNNAQLESSNKSLEVKITAMENNIKKQIELTNNLNKSLEALGVKGKPSILTMLLLPLEAKVILPVHVTCLPIFVYAISLLVMLTPPGKLKLKVPSS